MKVLLIADEIAASQFIGASIPGDLVLHRIGALDEMATGDAFDACIDLLFINDKKRISALKQINATIVIINAVLATVRETDAAFVRLNAWPTFSNRSKIECATLDDSLKFKAEQVLAIFGKVIEWVPDIAGFISTRVIASIINEAFYALDEQVSTKEEIDTAMKLGTNYPYGPFEWNKLIGPQRVHELLDHLSKQHERYRPAARLIKDLTE